MKAFSASVPGKIFLFGEYAVLHGAPSVVLAVNRRAEVQAVADEGGEVRLSAPGFIDTPQVLWPAPDEAPGVEVVAAAIAHVAKAHDGALQGVSLTTDTAAFSQDGRKIGLGSSAAVATACVAAVLRREGLAFDEPEAKQRLVAIAHAAHHEAQGGRGSGADVAAAVYGGALEVRSTGGPEAPRARPLSSGALPTMQVVWTGEPASTSQLVGRVQSFAAASPGRFETHINHMREIAARAVAAFDAETPAQLIPLAAEYFGAMRELGNLAGAPIVTPEMEILAKIAAEHGGAAKPSGAGGGDIAVVLLPSARGLHALRQQAADARLVPLDLAPDVAGLRVVDEPL